MKIVWVDDEIEKLPASITTLQVEGHKVIALDRVCNFLNWIREAKEDSVDVFWLDLMMAINWEDRERLESMGCGNVPYHDTETGIVLYNVVRGRFPNKPIIFLTVLLSDLRMNNIIKQDKNVRVVRKTARILPVLKVTIDMMEK